VDNWSDKGYFLDDVDGRLTDPNDDAGSDTCPGHDNNGVEDRSGVI
jgi:hypothetical protein